MGAYSRRHAAACFGEIRGAGKGTEALTTVPPMNSIRQLRCGKGIPGAILETKYTNGQQASPHRGTLTNNKAMLCYARTQRRIMLWPRERASAPLPEQTRRSPRRDVINPDGGLRIVQSTIPAVYRTPALLGIAPSYVRRFKHCFEFKFYIYRSLYFRK